MIYASLIFMGFLMLVFTPLDILKREIPNKILYPIFIFCAGVFFAVDFLIFKNVDLKEIGIGVLFFILTYILFTLAVMTKTIGPADVKIFSAFALFTPVYFIQPLSGIALLPAIDLIFNYVILTIPVMVFFKKVQPTHITAPALVTISLSVAACFLTGNVLLTVWIMLI